MWRIAIVSSITTGRFSTVSKPRMPVCGWLMIGTEISEPNGPGFVIVNVPPCTSSGWSFFARARAARSLMPRAIPSRFIVSRPSGPGRSAPRRS